MLDRKDFTAFFAAVNDGRKPFRWQERLLDHVLSHQAWPERIAAPTGSGKSSVVEVHVFATALSAVGGPRLPRRMCVVVNRRGLVDHHEARSQKTAAALHDSGGPDVLKRTHDALKSLRTAPQGPVLVAVNVRGGAPPSREWIDDPSACAVIAMTPDMWGSRLLFNGYGASRGARPREAGLLALDSVVVLDESHLSQQLLVTARDASRLVATDASAVGVPGLQVVEMSATPAGESPSSEVGVEVGDFEVDEALRERLTSPKPVSLENVPGLTGKGANATAIRWIADRAQKLRDGLPDAPAGLSNTVGIVVNRVDTAVRVAAELDKVVGREHVACWVGRMRTMDVERQAAERPGLFEIGGHAATHYLVATQTIEVGVDLDLAAMITELAPGVSVGQRLGRVNRLGRRARTEVVVAAPADRMPGDAPPYDSAELRAAVAWLESVAEVDDGASPWALFADPALQPPAATLPRLLLSRLYSRDIESLIGTSEPPFIDPELIFHLRDELADDSPMASVVLRDPLPRDDSTALALLEATPPDSREMFPTRLKVLRAILAGAMDPETGPGRAFLSTSDGLRPVASQGETLKPGDTLIVEPFPFTVRGTVIDPGNLPGVVTESDTLRLPTVWGPDGVRVYQVGHEERQGDTEIDAFEDIDPEGAVRVARGLADEEGLTRQVLLPPAYASEGVPDWVVITTEALASEDPVTRQEHSVSGPVTLEAHSRAVAARAAAAAEAVGLAPRLVTALRDAGHWHDSGKADTRFQIHRLQRRSGDPLWAKSTRASVAAVRRDRGTPELPTGWRHEQLSAAMVMAAEDVQEHELVCRLVGTSHGWGRPFFPHGPRTLAPRLEAEEGKVAQAADELFAAGAGWAEVLDMTHRTYGAWGCAYLEALLRSADCMVSKEGS